MYHLLFFRLPSRIKLCGPDSFNGLDSGFYESGPVSKGKYLQIFPPVWKTNMDKGNIFSTLPTILWFLNPDALTYKNFHTFIQLFTPTYDDVLLIMCIFANPHARISSFTCITEQRICDRL